MPPQLANVSHVVERDQRHQWDSQIDVYPTDLIRVDMWVAPLDDTRAAVPCRKKFISLEKHESHPKLEAQG